MVEEIFPFLFCDFLFFVDLSQMQRNAAGMCGDEPILILDCRDWQCGYQQHILSSTLLAD